MHFLLVFSLEVKFLSETSIQFGSPQLRRKQSCFGLVDKNIQKYTVLN